MIRESQPPASGGGYRFAFHPAGEEAPPVVIVHLDDPDATIGDIERLRTALREQGIDPNAQHVVYRDVETGRWEDMHPLGRMLRLRAETQDEALSMLARRRAPKGDEPCLIATATRDGGLELRVGGELIGVWYEGMSLAEVRDGARRKEETEVVGSYVRRGREFWQRLMGDIEDGASVADVIRRHGVARGTFDFWRRKLRMEAQMAEARP